MPSETQVQPKASRGIIITMRVLTVIMTLIWIGFGVPFLTHNREVVDMMHQLRYPMYITYFLGTTHILGGLGLLIPNRPRLSQWVFAGLTFDLLLASFSYFATHDTVANVLHPLGLGCVLAVIYMLRLKTGDNLWSSSK